MKTNLILSLCFASIGAIFAQTAPIVEWKRVTSPWRNHPQPFYPDGTPKPIVDDNRASGDDWWYDHTKSFDATGNQDGVVCTGYYSWRNQGHNEIGDGVFQSGTGGAYYYVEDFEDCNNRKGVIWASIMKFDNDGRNGFCRSYYTNEYNAIISANDNSAFYAVGTTSSSLHPEAHHNVYNTNSQVLPNAPIRYNPTSSASNDHFAHRTHYQNQTGENLLKHRKLKGIITKVDNNGNIIWSNLYGPRNYNQGGKNKGEHTLTDRSHIWNIAEDTSNGDLWVVGTERDIDNTNLPAFLPPAEFDNYTEFSMSRERLNSVNASNSGSECLNNWKPFLMCIDKNGLVKAKDNIDTDGKFGTGEALAIAVKNGKVYVAGSYTYGCEYLGTHIDNDINVSSAYVSCYSTALLSSSTNPFDRIWKRFQDEYYPTEDHGRATSILVNDDGNVLLPVIHSNNSNGNNAGPTSAHINDAWYSVYMFNGTTGNPVNSWNGSYEKIWSGIDQIIQAYDLKLDLIQTSDDGYALTTSVKNIDDFDNINQIDPSLLASEGCKDLHEKRDKFGNIIYSYEHTRLEHYTADLHGTTWFWDTDAYVAKYDANFNLEWDKTIEYGGSTREAYPGNAKRQECVYSITENQNGSFTIAGNTSDNFDDCYLINLQEPCQKSAGIIYDFASSTNGYTVESTLNHSYNTNNIWDITEDKTINGVLFVDEHTTLNITDATIQFTDHIYDNKITGIYVQHGGKLVINNSTITGLEDADCKARWDGIYVEGLSNENQFDQDPSIDDITGQFFYRQGYAEITNSTIKNARSAALHNFGINLNTKAKLWNNTGGMIRVENTDFINNRRSAEFLAYQNTKIINGVLENKKDRSHFNKCDFKTDENYAALYPNTLQGQITQWKVNGVDIKGCTFVNEDASNLLPKEKGTAIYSIDATYSVSASSIPMAPFPQLTRGGINGYVNGINVQNSSASYTNSISNQDFENNKQDLTLKFVNSPEIRDNTFVQLDKQGHKSILIVGPGNYDIRNNNFTSQLNVNTLADNPYSEYSESDYGIIVDNYGFRNVGSIKDNTIDGYSFATMFTNSGDINHTNTLLRCNAFGLEKDNAYAITLNGKITHDDDTFTPGGFIKKEHNYINPAGFIRPVGNSFSHFNNFPSSINPWHSDILNLNEDIILKYYHLPYDINTPDDDLYSDDKIQLLKMTGIELPDCDCGSDGRIDKYDVKDKVKMRVAIATEYNDWSTIHDNLNNLRDGGDKELLIEQIQNPTTQSAELRNNLVAESPYLSDDVLMEAIHRSIPLNDMHLAEVLVANLPLSRRVKSEFIKSPPFGNPLASIVLTPEGNGVRQLLELKELNAARELDEVLLYSLTESVDNEYDYISLDVWEYMNSIDTRNQYANERIDWLIDSEKFTEANTLANDIPRKSEDYLTWIAFNNDLQGRNHLQLNAQELNTLQTWSESDNAYLKKRGGVLLNLQNIFNITEDEYLLSKLEQPIQAKLNGDNIPESHWISLSDNPAKNEFYLYSEEIEKELSYSIHDIKGISISHGKMNNGLVHFDSSKWTAGIYFVSVTHPTLGKDVIKLIKHD